MIKFLNSVREPSKNTPMSKKIINTVIFCAFGTILGILSKLLDIIPSNELPNIIAALDVRNFMGQVDMWIFLAVVIAVYSLSPLRAAANVFVFFVGMLTGYYTVSAYIAGFFPGNYFLIWAAITAVTPVLAFICWYARGNGIIALIISSLIMGVLFSAAFNFGIFYFDMRPLETLVFIACGAVLYQIPARLLQMLGLSVIFGIIIDFLLPFGL